MDVFQLVVQSREAASVEEFLVVVRELRGHCHVLPKKAFFVFSLVSRRIWFIHSKQETLESTEKLWELLRELLSEFDPVELDSVKDDLVRLLFHEYERGSPETKEAVLRFVSTIETDSRLRDCFRVDYDVAVGGRKSPSFSAALKVCQDGRLWAPVLRLIETSALSKTEKGMSTYDRLFHECDGEQSNLLHLLKCGSVSYHLLLLAMFPVIAKESSRRAARKSNSSFSQSLALISVAFASSPALVSPLFAPIVSWCCAQWPASDAITVLQHLQSLLASADNEHMSELVLATRELGDKNWTRDWSWKIVSPALEQREAMSDGALNTIAAVVAVAPTVCFKLMDQRILNCKVNSGSVAAARLMCALISSHASLRALPDFLSAVCSQTQTGNVLRCAFEHDSVRSTSRDALRACLPSTARDLALVPKDHTSSVVVCDILRWGPVSEESRHAGWKPAEWAARIAAFAFPAKMSMLVESLMSALHYRWDPLTLQQIHKSGCFAIRDCLSLLGGGSQLRLARDFPSYWDKPSNSVQLSLQERSSVTPDWGVVLWGGDEGCLKEWLLRGPIEAGRELAWKPVSEARAKQVVDVLLGDEVDEKRKETIANAVPVWLLKAERDAKRVVRALVAGKRLDKLAKMIEENKKTATAAKVFWIESDLPLGWQAARAIASKRVWKRALKLARPQLWEYVGAYEDLFVCLERLVKEGMSETAMQETGCCEAWINVLGGVSEAELRAGLGGDGLGRLFQQGWRLRKWDLVAAIHECLVRVGVSEFGRVAMHKSLCLVLSLCDIVSDSFVSRLLSLSEYKMAVAAARADVSGRLLVILLQLPTEVQDRALLRQNVTEFLSLARSFSLLRAAACCERLMRLCPPYDVTQLAFYLQLVRLDSVTPELPEAPELVCHAMAALDAARRTVPSVWFRGAGIVAAFEQRAMELISCGNSVEWERAARAVGREIGGGGADLKQRKYYLSFVLGDWLSNGETRASLGVRNGVWQEGLVASMESCVTENDLGFSYSMVRGSNASKAAWKRYKRRYEETDKYTGKV